MREQMRMQKKLNRKKEVRRQIIILIVTFLFIVFLALTFGGMLSKANTPSEQSKLSYKYFRSVMTDYGDSLDSISSDYKAAGYHSKEIYLNEIININSITTDVIHSCDYLILPYYSNDFK